MIDFLCIFLILLISYTYVGYAPVLALLARTFRVHVKIKEDFTPSLTLLIVAYNEERVIEDKILNSLSLDYPKDRFEIVVASDGSSDGTNSIVDRYVDRGIRFFPFTPNRGKISALNEAMEAIKTDIVVLSDANVIYEKMALRKLARNFSDPRVGGVSGKVVLVNDKVSYGASEEGYYSIEHFIQEKEGETGALIGADGAMYAIRRELFVPPAVDTILDDFVISMSVACQGYLFLHEKEAQAFEENDQEVAGEFRRKVRILAGGIQCLLRGAGIPTLGDPLLLFKFISHKLLRWFVGPMTLLLLFLLITSQLNGAWFVTSLAFWGMTVGLGVAAWGQLVPGAKKIKVVNFAHYLFMLKAASLVGCYKGFTGRQKVTWRQ